MKPNEHHHKQRHLLGLGLDHKDNHKRITRGPDFHLMGGSEETHETMVEKTIKLGEKLKKRGKTIADASDAEFRDTAQSLDMPVHQLNIKSE